MFFYSSDKLTLRPGATLWGTEVGFAGTNYYIEVIRGMLDIETLISSFLRNIYIVNIGKFTNIKEQILSNLTSYNFDVVKISRFLNYLDTYNEVNTAYLLVVNILIIVFSYLFIRLFFNNFSSSTPK